MASAMASVATRNIPSPYYTIPVGPRVRPPRLLPGTKAANTNPQPNGPPPVAGHVWVQGKWRNPSANAARDRREIQSARTEKALRHVTHGMNIYAYKHIRTNQVVYSLTRVMQNNKILPQLLYHGKKSVPSALRRDVWRPYFSIHFSQDPAGARAGLEAYRRLRELSAQRQLSPPKNLVIATKEDVERAKNKYDPLDLKLRMKDKSIKGLPVKHRLLPKKLRAQKLMDQKATSVADAAFVLGLMNGEMSPAEELDITRVKHLSKLQTWSSRALRRLEIIRNKEAMKTAQLEARKEAVQPKEGQLGLTPHSARRIALEHGGAVTATMKGMEHVVENLESLTMQQNVSDQYLANSPSLLEGKPRPTKFNSFKFRDEFIEAWKKQHGDGLEGPSLEELAAAKERERRENPIKISEYDQRLAEARTDTFEEQNNRNVSSRKVQVLWADLRDLTWAKIWSNNVSHGELQSRAAIKHSITLQEKDAIDEDGNTISGQPRKFVFQASTTPHVFGDGAYNGEYQTPKQMNQKRQEDRSEEMNEWIDTKLAESRVIFNNFLRTSRSERLKLMEVYPSIFEKYQQVKHWRGKLATYAEFLKFKDEMLTLKSTNNAADLTIAEPLNKIIRSLLAFYNKSEAELIGIKKLKEDFEKITKGRKQSSDPKKQISALEASPSDSEKRALPDLRPELEDQRALVSQRLDGVWRGVDLEIERVLQRLESDEQYQGTPAIDLMSQRVDAQKRADTQSLESIDAEIKRLEEDKINQLLGAEQPVEANITEIDAVAIEKGLEQPPPRKRGILGRLFGR